MKVQSYVIERNDLTDNEYELLCNISGAWDVEFSFVVKISEIKECLDLTIENNGVEVCDCSGRHWDADYDLDINFMENLLKDSDECEFVIVKLD